MNYYNEFDPNAAAWLRQLIADKQIPNGTVDDRSITEVTPNDLKGFTQCHFFAGVGGWSLALRLAGVPENRRVWTASLPCQPFSTAGKQLGTDDERHLAPVFLELVRQCNPPVLFGEQVASKIARTQWLPGIRLELEALGYSFGAVDLSSPCAGEIGEGWIVRGDQESWERVIIGKPHIRQRLYWVADCRVENPSDNGTRGIIGEAQRCGGQPMDAGAEGVRQTHGTDCSSGTDPRGASSGTNGGLAHTNRISELRDLRRGDEGTGSCGELLGRGVLEADGDVPRGTDDGLADAECHQEYQEQRGPSETQGGRRPDLVGGCSLVIPTDDGLVDTSSSRPSGGCANTSGFQSEVSRAGHEPILGGLPHSLCRGQEVDVQSARNCGEKVGVRQADVFGSDASFQLLPCRDGKTRRTQFGIFPLVAGIPRGVVPSGDPGAPEYANATAEARAARLKGYGNAIQIDTAVLFIQTAFEALDDTTP